MAGDLMRPRGAFLLRGRRLRRVVDTLVIELARATGQPEAVVRLAHGLPAHDITGGRS